MRRKNMSQTKNTLTKNDVVDIIVQNNLMIFSRMDTLEKKLTNMIVEFKDAILHELIKIREDFACIEGHHDKIEDHEVQIEKIERHVFPRIVA